MEEYEYVRGKYLDVQNEQKNRYTFLGILQGITCDGTITIKEVQYILSWLNRHEMGMDVVPEIHKIKNFLTIILKKQIISNSEEFELLNILNNVSGSQWEKTHDTINMPINLYEKNPEIDFFGSCFVLTGNFEYGTKKECEHLIENLGGRCENKVTTHTDYLIVGRNGSKDWTHNSWGNKIEKAYKTEVTIISEDQLLEAVDSEKLNNL